MHIQLAMTASSEPNEPENAPPAATGSRLSGLGASLRRHLQGVQWNTTKTWLLIGLGLALILLVIWALSPGSPKPPPPPKLPREALLKGHHYWALGTVLLLVAAVGMSLHIGTLTLSGQTLAHRRNVLLGGVLLVLAELFNVDALKALSVDPKRIPHKIDGTTFAEDELVFGLLALFIVFSYVEYFYNFIADYIKARLEFRKTQKDNPLVLFSLRGVSQLFVGAGRIVFDVLLPVTVLSFAVLLYHRDSAAVVGVVQGFLENKFDTVQTENPKIKEYVEKATEAASSAQDGVSRTIEDIKRLPNKP